MKKLAFALALFVVVNTASAQTKQEAKVAAAVESLKQAMIDGDREKLNDLAADKLSYGHSGGKIEDKATFVETIASGKSDFVSIDLSNQTIAVSGKTAIVRHRLTAKTNDGGKPGAVDINILLVFQKQKGDWKLLARQAIRMPQ
ncbi:nuclear transport factor 2 family protein [Pedobacter sp. SYSU D00535]|uniref:nuclear transport factor 2 family protein n=1 Tax=Pedobacter sp. SYSU D00535 TaxID=2810308 RepID=UPI001A95E552|nr:nuclear transport factor 2 family protein [Pedobacter sp. SYSU D00535]